MSGLLEYLRVASTALSARVSPELDTRSSIRAGRCGRGLGRWRPGGGRAESSPLGPFGSDRFGVQLGGNNIDLNSLIKLNSINLKNYGRLTMKFIYQNDKQSR